MNENKLELKLKTIYFIIYGSCACYYPFLAVYFNSKGMTFSQIGIAFGLNSLVGIFAQPFWGYISDKHLDKRKTLLATLLICSVAVFSFVVASNYFLILASIVLLISFQSPIYSICDAFSYDIIEKHQKLQFGRMRLMGSIGFAIVSLIIGKIMEMTSVNAMFYAESLLLIGTAIILFGIQFEGVHHTERPSFKDIINVFKDFRFLLFLSAVTAASIATGANSSYITELLLKTGGNVSGVGFLWFVQAMTELPGFFLGNKLIKKYGELNIFIIAMLLYCLRFALNAFSHHYTAVIAISMMQGITYPIYLVAVFQYLNIIVPGKIRASGMTILSSLGFGLGNFLGNLGGGFILETNSIFFLYKLIAGICLVSILLGILLKYTRLKKADTYS